MPKERDKLSGEDLADYKHRVAKVGYLDYLVRNLPDPEKAVKAAAALDILLDKLVELLNVPAKGEKADRQVAYLEQVAGMAGMCADRMAALNITDEVPKGRHEVIIDETVAGAVEVTRVERKTVK